MQMVIKISYKFKMTSSRKCRGDQVFVIYSMRLIDHTTA